MGHKILFRGKRVDNGEWVYGSPLFDWADYSLKCDNQHNGELYLFLGWNDACHEYEEYDVNPDTIGQYTGLTDKNGVKIFERDIVRISMPIPWAKQIAHLSDVYFESGCFSVDWGGNCRPHHRTRIDAFAPGVEFEVIANIHDNKEVLGGNDGTTDKKN